MPGRPTPAAQVRFSRPWPLRGQLPHQYDALGSGQSVLIKTVNLIELCLGHALAHPGPPGQGNTQLPARIGAPLPADALLFPRTNETPSTPTPPLWVTQAFSRITRQGGFGKLRFHDLRHGCASHMLARGKPIPEVSKHLGHSNSGVTMSCYAHMIPRSEGGMGLLDELLPGKDSI